VFDNDHSGSVQDSKAKMGPRPTKMDESSRERPRLLVDEKGDAFVEPEDAWEKVIVKPLGKGTKKDTEAC